MCCLPSQTDSPKGRKLPNFAPSSPRIFPKKSRGAKKRTEYTAEVDTQILKYLAEKRLHNAVGGNRVWQQVSKVRSFSMSLSFFGGQFWWTCSRQQRRDYRLLCLLFSGGFSLLI